MGNPEHYGLLLHGHDVWNKWRFKNPKTKSELNQATLNGVNLYGINLKGTDLTNANLMDAYVNEVIFDRSKFENNIIGSLDLSTEYIPISEKKVCVAGLRLKT